jgi:surface carbohydrate biosynthesis protein (TIGR04326 family)
VIREELAGIALLQWPWSARAMDEAAAVLDARHPRAVVTYAEAGGWGRAIVLESRRRGIASVGLQHGFIYRHWLNYLHEPDEMLADPANPSDRGFPHPTRTLLFDDYAASHLRDAGRFPAESLAVTGSPRLDSIAATAQTLSVEAVENAKKKAGAAGKTLVLVTTKHREAHEVLRVFLDAAASVRGVHVAIKTHPAETPDVYADLATARANITVVPASEPLGPLLQASRVVVTVNSTVAIDAAVLGIPALVIGLPNNLSPFVEAGIMSGAGSRDPDEIARALEQILYDEEFRRGLKSTQQSFLGRFHMQADGRAADRAADAIVALAGAATIDDR